MTRETGIAMEQHKGKVAVVTGAASGIGLAIAKKCASLGMSVVLADIETEALRNAFASLSGDNNDYCVTDVSKENDIKTLADHVFNRYGTVDFLFNNAGVSISGNLWENTVNDWIWVLGVNLWGVIHGIQQFVPRMLEQNKPCHIVNTASIAGFTAPPNIGIYNVSKHAVVALSETLFHELNERDSLVSVSVLCPDFVSTNIMNSKRNRPYLLVNEANNEIGLTGEQRAKWEEIVAQGIKPEDVAEKTIEAIEDNRFYIFTHADSFFEIGERFQLMMNNKNPSNPHCNREL